MSLYDQSQNRRRVIDNQFINDFMAKRNNDSFIGGKKIAPMSNPIKPTTTGTFPAPANHAPAFKSGAGASWMNQSGMGGYQVPKAPTSHFKPIAGYEPRQNALLQSLHEHRNVQRQAEYDKINSNIYLQALRDAGTMQNTELKGGFDVNVANINRDARVQSADLYAQGRAGAGASREINPLDDMKKRLSLSKILDGVENYHSYDRDTQDMIMRRYVETGELPNGSRQTSGGFLGFGKSYEPIYEEAQNPQNPQVPQNRPQGGSIYSGVNNSYDDGDLIEFKDDPDYQEWLQLRNRSWGQ